MKAYVKAFTLIELLVVIAIIAIIAAIIFPIFASAREKARQATCVSNEKQIAAGILQYVQDNDEVMPYAFYWGGCTATGVPSASCQETLPGIYGTSSAGGGLGVGWPYLVGPYIASMKAVGSGYSTSFAQQSVFLCPDVPTNGGVSYAGGVSGPEWDYFPNSGCGRNNGTGFPNCNGQHSLMAIGMGNATGTNEMNETPMPYANIVRPADVMILTEMWTTGQGGYCQNTTGVCPAMLAATWFYNDSSTKVYSFHSGGANCMLADGHVKWYNAIQIDSDYDDMWANNSL